MPPDPAAAEESAKSRLRRSVRARRRLRAERTTETDRRAQALALADALEPLLRRLPTGSAVASFEPLPREPDVTALNDRVRRLGHRLLLPVLLADRDLSWRDGEHDLGTVGVRQADLVVLPALAVDTAGGRLGQGGGSYDRALARVAPGVPLIACVHADEVLPQVPTEAHDRPVHAVLTADGLRVVAPDPAPGLLAH